MIRVFLIQDLCGTSILPEVSAPPHPVYAKYLTREKPGLTDFRARLDQSERDELDTCHFIVRLNGVISRVK